MDNYHGNGFEKAFREGASAETLLKILDFIIVKIVSSVFIRAKIKDAAVSKEDAVQEVRLYLWEKLPRLMEMQNVSSREVFKYTTTLIKRKAYRYVEEIKYVNPRLKKKRKAKFSAISLSRIDLEFFDYKASYSVEGLISIFVERCKKIRHAERVFEFLTSDNNDEEYAGLSSNLYFLATKEMKQLAKDIAEEIPYE